MIDAKILNWMMQGPVQINDVFRIIDSSVLYDALIPDYKPTFNAINNYYSKHKIPPSYEVLEKLLFDSGDDTCEVHIIQSDSCIDNDIGYYTDKIRERYNKFLIKRLGNSISDDEDELVDINKKIRDLGLKTDRLYRDNVYSEGDISESIEDRVSLYDETVKNPNSGCGILSGYRELDEYTWGIKPSELVVIGGASSSGKSLLMMNMAINPWSGDNDPSVGGPPIDSGKNILFFSLEMSKEQLEMRVDSNLATISHTSLERGRLSDDDRLRWSKCLDFQKNYNKKFYIVDMPRGSTTSQIEAKYQSILGIFQPDAIYIDYLQLMSPNEGATGSDWLDIGKVSEEMHEFCRNTKLPVVTAAQRKASSRKGAVGKVDKSDYLDIEDLGRSKMIGDNANIVLLIANREDERLREDMEIHVVKNRNGPRGSFSLRKLFHKMKIDEIPDDWAGTMGDENEI